MKIFLNAKNTANPKDETFSPNKSDENLRKENRNEVRSGSKFIFVGKVRIGMLFYDSLHSMFRLYFFETVFPSGGFIDAIQVDPCNPVTKF